MGRMRIDVVGDVGFGPSLSVRVGRGETSFAQAEVTLEVGISGETNGTALVEVVIEGHSIDRGIPSVLDNLIEALTTAKAEAARRRAEKTR